MKIVETKVTKLVILDVQALDPVTVILHEFVAWGENKAGTIIITCFGKAWTATWGSMGSNLVDFFLSCDEHYLAKNLDSHLDSEVVDTDKLNAMAEEAGLPFGRDDPQHDYDMLADLFGSDPYDWYDKIPRKSNHEYEYLCRIIKAVQDGLKIYANGEVCHSGN